MPKNQKKIKKTEIITSEFNCPPHNFLYSHTEYPPTGTYVSIPPNKEVVICTKCGTIKKNNQI